VEFDADGGFLATGDKGGRVVLFERVPIQQVRRRTACRAAGACRAAAKPPYRAHWRRGAGHCRHGRGAAGGAELIGAAAAGARLGLT
jgi:hypothetical protein